MKLLVAVAAVVLLPPATLACDYGRQAEANCAMLRIADCSGEAHCEAAGPPPRVDTSRATPCKTAHCEPEREKRPAAKRRALTGHRQRDQPATAPTPRIGGSPSPP